MSVSKGFTRPPSWPPVGSIIRDDTETWAVVHLTTATLLADNGARIGRERLSSVVDRPFRVFRSGRDDYSEAWHQTLPWMETTR